MSSYSLPSSPESVSDEDNHPKARPWYEPDWTPEEMGLVPVESPERERSPSTDPKTKNRLLKKEERLEKKELEKEKKKEEEREEKAHRARIKRARENDVERMREKNRRALIDDEIKITAAEWKK
jgi:hypothetical protein